MVHIASVDLAARGIVLPSDRVGMCSRSLSCRLRRPSRTNARHILKCGRCKLITDTLRIAREAHHGVSKTHFTVFPEYSVPGRDGVALVQASLEAADWPSGTVVIGGTDGLSKADFSILAGEPRTYFDTTNNALARMGATEWVNCGITWVKAANGTVERWLQPKLSPAWPELNIKYDEMFRGNSLFAFNGPFDNGTQYRFCSLVCFDWIATDLVKKAWRFVVDELGRQATKIGGELPLSWLFVIQHNRRPSADSFLVEVGGFFDQREIPNVRRDRACLIFANSAGKAVPGKANLMGTPVSFFSPNSI